MANSRKQLLKELGRARNQRNPGIKWLRARLEGKRLTHKQAVLAKCCECMGYYEDGAVDCRVDTCPMYDHMPYRGGKSGA